MRPLSLCSHNFLTKPLLPFSYRSYYAETDCGILGNILQYMAIFAIFYHIQQYFAIYSIIVICGNILQYVVEEEYMGWPKNASGITTTTDLCCDLNHNEGKLKRIDGCFFYLFWRRRIVLLLLQRLFLLLPNPVSSQDRVLFKARPFFLLFSIKHEF